MIVAGVLMVGAGGLAAAIGGLGFALCFAGEARGMPSALATVLGGLAVAAFGLYVLGGA